MSKTPLADIKPTHTSTSVRRKRQRTYQTDRLATLFSKCFHMLFHLILKIILRNRCYHSYLVYKETDLKKLRDLSKWQIQDLNTALYSSRSQVLSSISHFFNSMWGKEQFQVALVLQNYTNSRNHFILENILIKYLNVHWEPKKNIWVGIFRLKK